MKRLSIKWRIFIYMLAFCVLLLTLLWFFQIVFLDRFYKSIKLSEIRRDASAISDYIKNGNWDQLNSIVSKRNDLFVEVWSVNYGTVIVTDNYQGGIQARMSQLEKISLYLQLESQKERIIKHYDSEEIFGLRRTKIESIMYSDIINTEKEPWMLMVSANISPVSSTVDTLRIQIYVISVVMIVMSTGIAFLIARHVSRPIERLNKSAAELGRGNYDAEFRGGGYKEAEELAGTLSDAAYELSRAERLRREIIANVSHDLRTPLALIAGYSEMIRDIPGEATGENMQVIIDESKRLTSLVNDLLDLSKLQADFTEITLQPFDLGECVGSIIDRLSQLVGSQGYTIRYEMIHNAVINGNENRISQVIYNLLTNAVNYTGDDKTVIVRQLIHDGNAVVQFIDSGEGIEPENLKNVWDRYYKEEKTHKRAVTGTGLGLSIVREIIGKHPGAEYGVASAPGEGSLFWFSLSC